MGDHLFPVHNNFHIGAYQSAINAGADLSDLGETEATERDAFVYRAYIALGSHQLVISEISDSAPTALQAVKLFAIYTSQPAARESVLESMAALLSDSSVSHHPTLLLMAANVEALEGNYPEALKHCHAVQNLELMALSVQILLKMDRPDVAEKTAKQMAAIDDDATLTQLAGAWVNVSLGGSKVQDAAYAFQELADKYTWTPKLYNGSAACRMCMGAHDEAEKDLLEALTKDGKDAETLANLIVTGMHLGRRGGAKLRTYMTQLRAVAPNHALLAKQQALEESFDAAAAAFA